MVQSSSSAREPWIAYADFVVVLAVELDREHRRPGRAISTAKKPVTATRKKYRASICAACSDACCGKNGKFVNIV